MFHSRENNQVTNFAHWRAAHKELAIDLVLGNHDILARDIYTSNEMTVHEEVLDAGPFLISHDVLESADRFYIHGDNSYYSKLTVNQDGLLVKVNPDITKELLVPSCSCCTHTFNGEVYS